MKISFYNGEFKNDDELRVKYQDRAFYFGDGVYEVIRYYEGEFFTLDEHLDRLMNSMAEIEIEGVSRQELLDIVTELKERNTIENGALYIQVSRGIQNRNHAYPVDVEPVVLAYINEARRPRTQSENGVHVITSEDYRWLKCHVKSLNLLANVMEKERAVKAGAHETVMHRDQVVTEGSSTNVFIVKNGVLKTHPANNFILNGITRLEVLKIAKQLGIETDETGFTVEELKEADEVIITSTTQEITPVVKIDDTIISDGQRGSVTNRIQEVFDANIHKLNLVK
ncbi:D-amino-acid transaminase [Salinicoccus halodurans]|uniref:D-alanine aminotransferase n=1 Tax=Salinicoccus halodurans TaxID=407035 RepID=A0A0F7HKB3_9STAP|nr:D-amino-acid transaminase [Salinicoccus halodurans]AKG74314.1 D-alanine aminotransferase [Salinicoccus halodurans]SFK94372.1 D-alanine aminotransferase apoenzyme [Salinicoccus halodurans]